MPGRRRRRPAPRSSLAEGLLLSLEQPFPVAVARLGQSITAEQQSPGVAPDTPAALVTLAALHGGDPVRARSVIGRAVRAGIPSDGAGEAFTAHRHRLLLGWVRMQDGQLSAATADAAAVATGETSLHRRDALWAAALHTAIARRSGDSGAVQKHWFAAMEVLAEYSVDLFSLLPLGELWIAAARMRQVDRLQHTLDEAFSLLESLGNPVLWSVPLHWAGVHAGILANSPEDVAPHGHALTAAAAHSAFAKTLATAGRTWLRVLANHVDIDEVTGAARGLSQFGLTWDATRLASQAALQTPDGRVSGAMLQLARDLKQTIAADEATGIEPAAAAELLHGTPRTGASRPSSSRLSDREREVAELLLLGMPYRDIGSQLFISAKTVEHHVAQDPAPARRRIALGDAVDAARPSDTADLNPRTRRHPLIPIPRLGRVRRRVAHRICRGRRSPYRQSHVESTRQPAATRSAFRSARRTLQVTRDGQAALIRPSELTVQGLRLTGFVDRVGDPVPLVAADGSTHQPERLLAEALGAMAQSVTEGMPVSDTAVAVPAHWRPSVDRRAAQGSARRDWHWFPTPPPR